MSKDLKNLKKQQPKAENGFDNAENSDGKASKGPQAPPPVKLSRGLMSWVVILALLIMLFVVLNGSKRGHELEWNQLKLHLTNNNVRDTAVLVLDDRITAELLPGTPNHPEGAMVYVKIDAANRDLFIDMLKEMPGVHWKINTGTSVWMQLLIT